MRNLNVGSCQVHTDFWAIDPHTEKLVMASLVSNSKGELASAAASIQLGSEGSIRTSDDSLPRHYFNGSSEGYSVFAEAIEHGKSSVIHALLWAKDILTDKGTCFAVTEGTLQQGLYEHLYRRFNLPLLKEWSEDLLEMLMKREEIYAISIHGESPGWMLYRVTVTEDAFKDLIREGLKTGSFKIAKTPQRPLEFQNLDQYYMRYGDKIIRQLEQRINPLTERIQTVEVMTKKKNLFPEQAEMVNAMQALLKTANYCIVNQGMGCGKTIQGAVTIEKIGIDAVRELDLQKSVEQAAYRAIIMCPGHLVEKWKEEIEGEIPLATATILRDFAQVTALAKLKHLKPTGKEFYIFSKDFAKLSYQEMPIVRDVRKRPVRFVKCDKCEKQISYADYRTGKRTCSCSGGGVYRLEDHHHHQKGLVCPECGELAWPNVQKLKIGQDYGSEEEHRPLMPVDFAEKTDRNRCCSACGTTLWGPNLQNYSIAGTTFGEWVENRSNPWIRITHHLNQAKKGTKSVWVHKKYMYSYLESKKLEHGDYSIIRNSGVRKYAPAAFIKKRLPKFFDFAVFDEFHEYKGGDTAQGHAMHCLVKASKRQLCLTGTIAGGVATHLFHLMYRLDPGKMLAMGYKHTDELKFAQDYGVVETVTVRDTENGVYNSSSRGKKSQTISVKPGISPLLYSMFLLDRTVFLDLEDLAAYLPPLYEYVRTVSMNPDVLSEYNRLRQQFKTLLNAKGGKKLLASMLQSLLAYPDKPFGFNPVLCPATGNPVIHFEEHKQDVLYPKEEQLLSIVRDELKEGRNSVIYLEYTGKGDKNVVSRLKEILEKNLDLQDKVAVLNSSSPEPSKREAWLKKQAVDGKKVIICNPRCVQTGLDFVFDIQGKTYNYPTLVFYQLGYNLFTLWQASRRHYRLSQKEECRTFYLAYAGTLQEGVIKIMADKKVATAAIQGKFSSEGLAAMAQSVDAQVELAKMLMDRDTSNAKDLEEKFAMINSVQNQSQGARATSVTTTQRWKVQPVMPLDMFNAMEEVFGQIEFTIVEKTTKKMVEGQLSFI